MKWKVLNHFFKTVKEDHRIGTTHISLYMALFELWTSMDVEGPVCITRQKVMQTSKIYGLATYHKCIRDLNDYGYIRYEPSFNPAIQSKVSLLC